MSPVAFYKLPVAGWLDSTSRRKLHAHDMFNFHRHVDITMIGQQVHNVSRIRKLLESRFADFKLSELCFAETRIADDRFWRHESAIPANIWVSRLVVSRFYYWSTPHHRL